MNYFSAFGKILDIGQNEQATLPSSVRKKLGVGKGAILEIEIINDAGVIVPRKLVDKRHAYF